MKGIPDANGYVKMRKGELGCFGVRARDSLNDKFLGLWKTTPSKLGEAVILSNTHRVQ